MRKKINKDKVLPPVHPNAGLEAIYRDKLTKLIQEMHDSILYWISAAYRKNEPVLAQDDKVAKSTAQYRYQPNGKEFCGICTMFQYPNICTAVRGDIFRFGWCQYFEKKGDVAQDASPSQLIRAAFRKNARKWEKKWRDLERDLAQHFARSARVRTERQLTRIFRKAGVLVDFRATPAVRDIMHATVQQNVALIRTIPQQYLGRVEVLVMQAVQSGGDLGTLSRELERQFRVTKKRAALIARDQNRKANSAFTRARYLELNIKKAIWLHSGAGKEPRPTHVANHGKKFDVKAGWYDPAEGMRIHPGYLINCRCVSRPVLPGGV